MAMGHPLRPIRHVLVVENDPAIRRMLAMMLELEGYDARTAAGAAAGLELLRASGELQVVLVNHLMPDLDGPAVLSLAATDAALARHRYVLMSSCPHCHPGPPATLPYRLL